MAHFIGSVRGSKGEASRLAGKESGISAKAQGWDIGGEVRAWNDKETGRDLVALYVNGGSNGSVSSKLIGIYAIGKNGSIEKVKKF